jgi:Transposase
VCWNWRHGNGCAGAADGTSGSVFRVFCRGCVPVSRFAGASARNTFDGISRSRLAKRERVASATIERWFAGWLAQLAGERISAACPQILGIDEHFFTRRHGYATTFCDLKNHKIHDVVLGRSEASLEGYLARLEGKDLVKVVCMDLATGYRALVRKHFPQAALWRIGFM